jgi:rhodanese-related sulfurtransferase
VNDERATWRADFLIALGMAIIGSLFGLLWNPSALRATEVKITKNPLAAAYLEEIGASEVEALIQNGSIQIVDSRQRSLFEAGHLIGALPCWDNDTEFLISSLIKLLPLDANIVVVDELPVGYGGRRIAGLFAARGYKNVRLLKGGVQTWRQEKRRLAKGWDFDAIKKWSKQP